MSRSRAGITLLEILIAVSLLSLLSIGSLIAMRIGFNTMEKTDAHLIQNRRVSNSRRIIESEITGFMWSLALWRKNKDSNAFSVPFVQWEPRTMRFLTAYSLDEAWRGRPHIAALQVIPGQDNKGVRLIVNQSVYTGPDQAGQNIAEIAEGLVRFSPVLPGSQSFVLADRLAECHFEYLETLPQAPWQNWRSDWLRPRVLPRGIRVVMTPFTTAPSELHVTTVTVALPVNRSAEVNYADIP